MFQSEEGSLTDSARTEPSHPAEALETWNKEEERCSGSNSVFPFISLLEAEKQKTKSNRNRKGNGNIFICFVQVEVGAHSRRINADRKAKVVDDGWGTYLNATLTI